MSEKYDVSIVGGGIAGLTASIHLALLGHNVALFEKNSYPQHKVCGEYVSKEVEPYLCSLGMESIVLESKSINEFQFSSIGSKPIQVHLDKGGFGISRFALDLSLFKRASQLGVHFFREKVIDIHFEAGEFTVETRERKVQSRICLGAFGKRSILDKNLNRDFSDNRTPWLAVKAHYKANVAEDMVGLHHFEGGYCGVSMVETGLVNVCYLIHQRSFEKYKDLSLIEEKVLAKNKNLKSFFEGATMEYEKPLTISQIYFGKREQVVDHILMLGDAGGMIYPLAGNGMAIAFHTAKIAVELVHEQLVKKSVNHDKLSQQYLQAWQYNFKARIRVSSWMQFVLERSWFCKICLSMAGRAKFLLPWIIKRTHGPDLEMASLPKVMYKDQKNAI